MTPDDALRLADEWASPVWPVEQRVWFSEPTSFSFERAEDPYVWHDLSKLWELSRWVHQSFGWRFKPLWDKPDETIIFF